MDTLTQAFAVSTTVSTVLAVYMFRKYNAKNEEGLSINETIKKNKKISDELADEINELRPKIQELNEKLPMYEDLKRLEHDENSLRESLYSKQDEMIEMDKKRNELVELLDAIKNSIDVYSPQYDLIEQGFFEEPKYFFETSDRFKEEIKLIREEQKDIIRKKDVVIIPESVAIIDDDKEAQKALQGQAKMMLRSFNIECDLLIGSVKPSNYAKTLERIQKAADDIEKTVLSFKCGFSDEYISLKYKECQLQYQFKLKEEAEKEEQRIIKEQMREEQKAIREYDMALRKAQEEEKMYQDALEQARHEMELAGAEEKDAFLAKIQMLEQKLKEAEENEGRAKSMAEQTKRGHVYVISNIGSFGDNVYKIGMTRRLEPLDRVKELGDASVPFSFDVHALIFSDDAPKLESDLHRAFNHKRVNAVNLRKEFFNVDLLDIKSKATEITGSENDFRMTALAEEYKESLKFRRA